jgi:hypothetical protein
MNAPDLNLGTASVRLGTSDSELHLAPGVDSRGLRTGGRAGCGLVESQLPPTSTTITPRLDLRATRHLELQQANS